MGMVDVAEPPCEDVTTNFLRVKCVAMKDKVTGWVTVREGGIGPASLFLRPATAEEVTEASAAAAAEEAADAGVIAPSTPPQAPGKGVKRPAAPWGGKEEIFEPSGFKGKGKFQGKGNGKGKFKKF